MASEVLLTKMNDGFILVNNVNGCELQFVTDVPEKYKTVQIDGICKEELTDNYFKYHVGGALMQDAFPKLTADQRELIVNGPGMLEMYNNMGEEG